MLSLRVLVIAAIFCGLASATLDVCHNHFCPGEHYHCVARKVPCDHEPCFPIPLCVRRSLCDYRRCRDNTTCVEIFEGKWARCLNLEELTTPAEAHREEANYDVCFGYRCPSDNLHCVARKVKCVREPCPPIPHCVERSLCDLRKCMKGTTCVEIFNGKWTRCMNLDQLSSSTTEETEVNTHHVDVCENYHCPTAHLHCVARKVKCEDGPCSPIPLCVAHSPCDKKGCHHNSTCVESVHGRWARCMEIDELVEVHNGDDCVCTMEYEPVCGMDDKTYPNACHARCAGVDIKKPGECIAHNAIGIQGEGNNPSECLCPALWDPVCGEDGHTYSNECVARCAVIKVHMRGECDDH